MSKVDPNNPIPPFSAIQEASRYIREQRDRETSAQILQLKAALLPFAMLLQSGSNFDKHEKPFPDNHIILDVYGQTITVGDLRRAYAAVVS